MPATDPLIMACAHHHGADLVHADRHFEDIVRLRHGYGGHVDTASGEVRHTARSRPRRT